MATALTTSFHKTENGRFTWAIVGPAGAFHIWAQLVDKETASILHDTMYGGIEVHYKKKPYDFSPDEAPIKNCWLTGCDCWPDGSSLQFEEQIKPIIEHGIDNPEQFNDFMFCELRARYKSMFGE